MPLFEDIDSKQIMIHSNATCKTATEIPDTAVGYPTFKHANNSIDLFYTTIGGSGSLRKRV
jgi:hypothetical protein